MYLKTFSVRLTASAILLRPVISSKSARGKNEPPDADVYVWSVGKLHRFATGHKMAAAIVSLAEDTHVEDLKANELPDSELRKIIAMTSDHDIRGTILEQTRPNDNRKGELAHFVGTNSGAATCVGVDTAGGDGLDVCVAGCERKPSLFGKTSHTGACYALCSLAVAPCLQKTKPDTLLAITHDVLPTLKASFGVLKDNITGRDPTSSSIALDVVYLIISYPGVLMSVVILWMLHRRRATATRDILRGEVSKIKAMLDEIRREDSITKLRTVVKLRKRVALRDGFYRMHAFAAWSIYFELTKKADLEAGLEILGGLLAARDERKEAIQYMAWKWAVDGVSGMAESNARQMGNANRSAVVDWAGMIDRAGNVGLAGAEAEVPLDDNAVSGNGDKASW